MILSFGNMALDFNIFNLVCQPTDPHDELLHVNMIKGLFNEHLKEKFFDELVI